MPPILNVNTDDRGYRLSTTLMHQEQKFDHSGPEFDFTLTTNGRSNIVRKQPVSSQQRESVLCGMMPSERVMTRPKKARASTLLCKPPFLHGEQIHFRSANNDIIRRSSYPLDNENPHDALDQDEKASMYKIVKKSELYARNSSVIGGLSRSKYELKEKDAASKRQRKSRREDENKSKIENYISRNTISGQGSHNISPYSSSGTSFAKGEECWNFPICSYSQGSTLPRCRRFDSCVSKQRFPPTAEVAGECVTDFAAECVNMTTDIEVQELQRELRDLKRWASTSPRFDEDITKTKAKPEKPTELQLEKMDSKRLAPNSASLNGKKEIKRRKEKRFGVRFTNPVVTSTKLRPYTRREDIPKLFFDQDELDMLEIDRENRIPEEQVECVATEITDDHFLVSVSFPKRLSRKQLREQRHQKKNEKRSFKAKDI